MYPPFRRSPNLFPIETATVSTSASEKKTCQNNYIRFVEKRKRDFTEKCGTVMSEVHHTPFLNQRSWGSFGVPVLLGLGLGILTIK